MILPFDSLKGRSTFHCGSSIHSSSDSDWPPTKDENEADRALRLEQEREAKLKSNAIDASILSDAAEWQMRKRNASILLVGTSLTEVVHP
jgi:hypothetical protein